MSNSQGIQELLRAEKLAAETVATARKRKAARLKAAKDEADAEIARYRNEREAAFQLELKNSTGQTDVLARKLTEDTEMKIRQIAEGSNRNKTVVIQKLLDVVCDIKPVVHRNRRD